MKRRKATRRDGDQARDLLVSPLVCWKNVRHFSGRNAVDSGVGLALDHPPSFTADGVVEKLRRLLKESSFCERAQYWGEQLRKAGGVGRAADVVLTAAATRRVERHPAGSERRGAKRRYK